MGWDERNDEYLIEFTEQQLAEHDAEIRAEAIDEAIAIVKSSYRMDALEKLEQLKDNK